MSDELIQLLKKIAAVEHFDSDLYQQAFALIGTETKTHVMVVIANTLEEYYNYHNRYTDSGTRKSKSPIPPEAGNEREDLELYIKALERGITNFNSVRDLKAKLTVSRTRNEI